MSSKPIIVIGSGGHARVCIDLLKKINRKILGIVTIDSVTDPVLGVPIVGGDEAIRKYSPKEVELINGVGHLPRRNSRKNINLKFKEIGYIFPPIVHPSAVIGSNVHLSQGCQIMAGVIIQAGTIIRENTIINTKASIDHDCVIMENCHVAPSATLCGNVKVGQNTFIGAGSVITNGIEIGDNVIIAAGKTVVKSIDSNGTLIKSRQDHVPHVG